MEPKSPKLHLDLQLSTNLTPKNGKKWLLLRSQIYVIKMIWICSSLMNYLCNFAHLKFTFSTWKLLPSKRCWKVDSWHALELLRNITLTVMFKNFALTAKILKMLTCSNVISRAQWNIKYRLRKLKNALICFICSMQVEASLSKTERTELVRDQGPQHPVLEVYSRRAKSQLGKEGNRSV